MELFIPGLAALLLAGLIVFLVIPRLGAPILAVLSIVLLAYGVYNHMTIFGPEYRYSTWQDRLKFYGPFLMIAALILGILFYVLFLFTTVGVNALPASNIPTNTNGNSILEEVTNTIANTVKNTAEAVGAATEAVATNLKNTVTNVISNNRKNNANRGVLSNLGNILSTPNRR